MKNILIATMFLTLLTGYNYAQSDKKFSSKNVEIIDVPILILSAADEDFPAENKVDWVILSDLVFNERYQGKLVGADKKDKEAHYYQMTRIGKDLRGFAVYDREGELIHSRLVMEKDQLPRPIVMAITKKYLGWNIIGDKEVIITPGDHAQTFSFEIERGSEKRRLLMAEDGRFVKDLEGKK
jgi:hypothetical protein